MATKQELRIDILVALFGDNNDKGARDLSDSEKLFILNNSGVRAEISACLKDFSQHLTSNNKVLGREIKLFLKNSQLTKYSWVIPDHLRYIIDFTDFEDSEIYDISGEEFGCFTHDLNKDIQVKFLDLFKAWLPIPNKEDCAIDKIKKTLPTLSQEKLDKILEIINANEVEGLSNFSLGDK
jgi:hypothetical protein